MRSFSPIDRDELICHNNNYPHEHYVYKICVFTHAGNAMNILAILGILGVLLLSGATITVVMAWRISTRSIRYEEQNDD